MMSGVCLIAPEDCIAHCAVRNPGDQLYNTFKSFPEKQWSIYLCIIGLLMKTTAVYMSYHSIHVLLGHMYGGPGTSHYGPE